METALKTSDVLARLNISEDTLYALVKSKRIRAVRLGRRYRFDAEAVEEFLRGEEYADEDIEVETQDPGHVPVVPKVSRVNELCTYFVQRQSGGPIKIGMTRNFKSRLASLQSGSPEPFVCLCRLKGNFEVDFHHRFDHLRISGEWFRPEPDLLVFINETAIQAGVQ